MQPPGVLVYALTDPRNNAVRYVGKSVRGLARPAEHREPSRLRGESYKERWIRSLQRQGLTYGIEVLAYPSVEELDDEERKWIRIGRAEGWPLTNAGDGGEGRRPIAPQAALDAWKAKAFARLARGQDIRRRAKERAERRRIAARVGLVKQLFPNGPLSWADVDKSVQ